MWGKRRERGAQRDGRSKRRTEGKRRAEDALFCLKLSFSFAVMKRLATISSIPKLPGAPAGKCRTPGLLTNFPALRQLRSSVTRGFPEGLLVLPQLEGTALLQNTSFCLQLRDQFLLCSEWVLHHGLVLQPRSGHP